MSSYVAKDYDMIKMGLLIPRIDAPGVVSWTIFPSVQGLYCTVSLIAPVSCLHDARESLAVFRYPFRIVPNDLFPEYAIFNPRTSVFSPETEVSPFLSFLHSLRRTYFPS